MLQNKARSGKFPIPLCASSFNTKDGLKIADYSPFEIGSKYTQTYFPLEYYQIESYQASLPPGLSEFMAVWGSAFCAKLDQIIPALPDGFPKLLGDLTFLHGAKVMNANYNRIDETTGNPLPLANHKYLYYEDGAVDSNVPLDPLLRPDRKVNVVIMWDASWNVRAQPFLNLVAILPAIKDAIPTNPTFPYVFPATPDYPTIIYIPLVKDIKCNSIDPDIDCGTLKFLYTEDEAAKLFELAYYLTMQAKDTIWNVINSLKG